MHDDETTYLIDFALDCTPPADRARLRKILDAMDTYERALVCGTVNHHCSGFNRYGSETPGSAGQTAHHALVTAIKSVKMGYSHICRKINN
ncbi:hypothetical protein V0M98_36585 (plasmid) [Pseudomonas silesiensis]|uniref:hypothetical protein n=1 Tax=Pseudomonas silesiensis TaxID=1853130 RepID=UPI0030D1C959